MVKVNVSITHISAERFWDSNKPIPPIKINTNLNIFKVEEKSPDFLEVYFVLTGNYNPSIAQMNLKGIAYVKGDVEEITKIFQDYKEKKPLSPVIMQSISNIVFSESILISKTLRIPPPIPLPQITQIGKPFKRKTPKIDYSA
jgi:hypothetical protein